MEDGNPNKKGVAEGRLSALCSLGFLLVDLLVAAADDDPFTDIRNNVLKASVLDRGMTSGSPITFQALSTRWELLRHPDFID